MKTRIPRPVAPLTFAIALLAAALGAAPSQEQPATSKPAKPPEAAPSPTAKALAALKTDEGTWDADLSFWFRPGAEPSKCHATVTATMDLGGMFLEQRFEGAFGPDLGNKAFTTLSYTGFNPSTNEYEAVRMASTHSTMIVVRGKPSPDDGKGLSTELKGEYQFMGGKATERDIIRHEGPDKCIIESWMSFGGVPEFKGAEMVLTRKN
jgi:hypothetical protein